MTWSVNKILRLAILAAALAVVGASILSVVFYIERPKTPDTSTLLVEASTLANQGNFEAAKDKAKLLIGGSSDVLSFKARSILEVSEFMGKDLAGQVQAVSDTKAHFDLRAGHPFEQALQVNKLLGYLTPDSDVTLYEAVFDGDPFESMYVPEDRLLSVKNLAEFSMGLYPMSVAAFEIAEWHAIQIGGVYSDVQPTSAERADHLASIDQMLILASQLVDKEKSYMSGRPFDFMVEPRYLLQRVQVLTSVPEADYLTSAQESLSRLLDIASVSEAEGSEQAFLIKQLVPYAEFWYAVSLYKVGGEASLVEATSYLDSVMNRVESDPDVYEATFGRFLREQAKLQPPIFVRKYGSVLKLADRDPRFKAFLSNYGWSI